MYNIFCSTTMLSFHFNYSNFFSSGGRANKAKVEATASGGARTKPSNTKQTR